MKRFSCVGLVEVKNGNPNGDPEDGSPRILNNGHGLISSVSFKRKIRDLIEDHSNPVTKEIFENVEISDIKKYLIFESHKKGFENDIIKNLEKIKKEKGDEGILNMYWDSRVFGTTGLEIAFKRTGAVFVSHMTSIAPIEIVKYDITKKATMRKDLMKSQQSDIAPEGIKMVEHGLYHFRICFDVSAAHNSLTTEKDIQLFRELCKHVYDHSASFARPTGSVNLIHLWTKYHDKATCSFSESQFTNDFLPTIKNDIVEPRSLNDYHIPTPESTGWKDVEDWAM